MTITITKEGLLDSLFFAWLLFAAAFMYIGVMHLETISRCLVIQTDIMTRGSGVSENVTPPDNPQAPADKETIA